MKRRFILLCIILTSSIFSCNPTSNKKIDTIKSFKDTVYKKDSILLQAMMNLGDGEEFEDSLSPIKENFKKINSITNWDSIVNKNLWLSAEGGYVNFYYANSRLEKALVRYYGEMGQGITEYYFLGGDVSFVFDKYYHYNAPTYLDSSLAVKEGNDLFFNMNSSIIAEKRIYFQEGNIIRIITNQKGTAIFDEMEVIVLTDRELQLEQKIIEADLAHLLVWAKSEKQEFFK